MPSSKMQKSAHTNNKALRRGAEDRQEPASDKGSKFEPFFVGHVGTTRGAAAQQRRFDQKR